MSPVCTDRVTPCSVEHLRLLTALQALDEALWSKAEHVETAYAQQALRYLTHAIEGHWDFKKAIAAIEEMMP